jgi:hypothetical protein
MDRYLNRKLLVAMGAIWLIAAAAILLFLLQYLAQGAGLQLFAFISTTGILLGTIHIIGLATAALISLSIGLALCSHAFSDKPALAQSPSQQSAPGT